MGHRVQDRTQSRGHGFTIVELLAVVALIVILISLLLPSLAKVKTSQIRLECKRRQRSVGNVFMVYAIDNGSCFPKDAQYNGNWMWDLSRNTVVSLTEYGVTREEFYCPIYPEQNVEGLWEFTPDFRVAGYFYNFRRTNGPMASTPLIGKEWLDGMVESNPASSELITDVVISQFDDFTEIHGGWSEPHRSSHFDAGSNTPAGGNVYFLDGHAEWRSFDEMERRLYPAAATPTHWF